MCHTSFFRWVAAAGVFFLVIGVGCAGSEDPNSTPQDAGTAGSAAAGLGGTGGASMAGSGGSATGEAGAAGGGPTGQGNTAGQGTAGGPGGAGTGGTGGLTARGGAGGAAGSGGGGSAGAAGRGGAGGRGGASGGSGGAAAGSGGSSTGRGGGGGSITPTGAAGAGGRLQFVGNITTSNAVDTDGKVFSTYWDQISPENAGKWGSVQSSAGGTFNWRTLDAIYDYTQQKGIYFKEHTFIWGSQQPGGSISEANVKTWMTEFCKRYPNTKYIDVVNEPPPHTTPSYANSIGGGTNGNWQWITNAFKWAREACPNAILLLNDYNTIEWTNDNSHFISIVKAIKTGGAPIDAVGAQGHDLDHGSVSMSHGVEPPQQAGHRHRAADLHHRDGPQLHRRQPTAAGVPALLPAVQGLAPRPGHHHLGLDLRQDLEPVAQQRSHSQRQLPPGDDLADAAARTPHAVRA